MNRYNDLIFLNPYFDPSPTWSKHIPWSKVNYEYFGSSDCVKLFDQNGYDLSPVELLYAKYNGATPIMHRNENRYSLQKKWFMQHEKLEGYVLNHCLLFERKGYSGEALNQLLFLAETNPLLYKVISINPKWGIDFSLDYVDRDGNCMEIFHYEYDGFEYDNILKAKETLEDLILTTDFDEIAEDLIQRKDEWFNLEFFDQSDWKCDYFGVPHERFKMVVWQ